MNNQHEQLTDLRRLSEEILHQPPEAALPSKLSNEWLDLLERDLRIALRPDNEHVPSNPSEYMKAPLLLIDHIAVSKSNSAWAEISLDDLFKYFRLYQAEVLLEKARRCGTVDSTPATLESIFADREIYLLRPNDGSNDNERSPKP